MTPCNWCGKTGLRVPNLPTNRETCYQKEIIINFLITILFIETEDQQQSEAEIS